MSQGRQFNRVGGNYHHHGGIMGDTTYTKLFVGGLAWETQRDTMKKYFEQFGDILEAVVITDKTTGRSKGYGFVTFKEPDAAFRARQNPSPVIDGRRANCNLASFGVQKNNPQQQQQRQPTPPHHVAGGGRLRGSPGLMPAPPQAYVGPSSYFHQPPFPYSPYGYPPGYPHDTMYHMNYYGGYGQQYTPYYPTSGGATTGGGGGGGYFYPYYTTTTPPASPYAHSQQSSQAHAHAHAHAPAFSGYHHPHMVQQYPFLPQHNFTSTAAGILSLPTPTPTSTSTVSITNHIPNPTTTSGLTTTVGASAGTLSGPSQVVSTQQNSTT